MEFKNEIADFISNELGGITILEQQSKKIVCADKLFKEKYGDNVIRSEEHTSELQSRI